MTRPTVTALDPRGLPAGIHERWLHVVDDALGLPVRVPVLVARGAQEGPVMGLTGAVHGDELNGIDIVGRLIRSKAIERLRGTLIAVPMVNVYGVLNQSRYLPDRRDLNRSFPGSKKGSLAGRLAHQRRTHHTPHPRR